MRGPGPRSTQRLDLRHRPDFHLLSVEVAPATAEATAAELWARGAVGIEETPTCLIATFIDAGTATRARDLLSPHASVVAAAEVAEAHMLQGPPAAFSAGRFAIHPPGVSPPAGSIPIVIDPGRAFGTGSHASTRLALRLLGDEVTPSTSVLDVGCGTGVLAIAAASLGARVVAIDTDPDAIGATRANAESNGVHDRIEVGDRVDAIARSGPVDLITINMTIDGHESIAAGLPFAPSVVASGLLAGPQVERAAAAHRGTIERHETDGEWVGLLLRRGSELVVEDRDLDGAVIVDELHARRG